MRAVPARIGYSLCLFLICRNAVTLCSFRSLSTFLCAPTPHSHVILLLVRPPYRRRSESKKKEGEIIEAGRVNAFSTRDFQRSKKKWRRKKIGTGIECVDGERRGWGKNSRHCWIIKMENHLCFVYYDFFRSLFFPSPFLSPAVIVLHLCLQLLLFDFHSARAHIDTHPRLSHKFSLYRRILISFITRGRL